MAPTTPDEVVLLEMMIRGRVIIPENKREFEAEVQRSHNVAYWGRKPAMFVMCHDAGDVQEALQFATKRELPISIRSGGHGADGSSIRDGTVVIDLSRMRSLSYDPSTELVTIEPGCLLSDVNVLLLRHGRMAPVGVAPPTGCGGLCLHGGVGFLTHRFGTAVDNITNMEIILADGSIRDIGYESTGDDKELFFAARGAAGCIGIVTRFTLRTYPTENITGGFWVMLDDANYTSTRKLIKQTRDMVTNQDESVDRKLTGVMFYANVPPDPSVAEEFHGKPCTIVFAGVWGDDQEALDMVKLLCDRDIVMGQPPAVMPFNLFNQILSGLFLNFPPFASYWKNVLTHSYPDDQLEAYADIWTKHDPAFNMSFVGFEFYGGKGGTEHGNSLTEGNDHCVSSLRNFTFSIPSFIYFLNEPGMFEKGKALSREMTGLFSEFSSTCYSNFQADIGSSAEEKKEAENKMLTGQERLRAIKKKVDPQAIFSSVVISLGG